MLAQVVFIVVYGVSLGMILFMISVGLAVTMGVMRIVNMAHGAFAATGAYLMTALMTKWGLGLGIAVATATIIVALISVGIERLFYRPIYQRGELDHVLLTIGLVFLSIAMLTQLFGPDPIPASLPFWLNTNVTLGPVQLQVYRLVVIVVGAIIMLALWTLLNRTMFGVRLRAAVDNNGMAQAVGINVRQVYSAAFALGAGLAAFGGAVGYGLMPPEPTYAFKYLVLILFVVGLAGEGKIMECGAIAVIIGVIDTAARFYIPTTGSYLVYVLAVAWMLYLSRGVFYAR